MENLAIWQKAARPPREALREIKSGRLKGKSDVNPVWRIKLMTELFGLCGIGWKYVVTNKWLEPGAGIEICAFADVDLYIKLDGEWSEAIPGTGGSKIVAQESAGPHTSDEGYKMAVTDALSVAMKNLGVAADIYMGLWDGSKYITQSEPPAYITQEQVKELTDLITTKKADLAGFKRFFKIDDIAKLQAGWFDRAKQMLVNKPDPPPKTVAPESGAQNA